MFSAVLAAIRAYIIMQLAQIVVDDIVTNGLTPSDEQIIDDLINTSPSP